MAHPASCILASSLTTCTFLLLVLLLCCYGLGWMEHWWQHHSCASLKLHNLQVGGWSHGRGEGAARCASVIVGFACQGLQQGLDCGVVVTMKDM